MIRGRLIPMGARRRPFVLAQIAIASQGISDDINLLVDTGADSTLLSPSDATRLRLDLAQLPPGSPSTGVGGPVPTVYTQVTLTLDRFNPGPLCVSVAGSDPSTSIARATASARAYPLAPGTRYPRPFRAVLRRTHRPRPAPHPSGGRRPPASPLSREEYITMRRKLRDF
jgi:hypothetical protein